MRNFDTSMIAEITKEITSTFFLLELQLTETHYYTDRDIPLYYESNKYEPVSFDFGNVAYAANMSVDKVTTDIDNINLSMSALLLGEDVRNKTSILSFGCIGESVVQWDEGVAWSEDVNSAAWYQDHHRVIGVVELFRGFIGDWELSEIKARITQVNEFIFWKKKTLRICQPSCPWPFKDTTYCKYAGVETWCDQSWNRCYALGNDANFGGFRFLPDISEKAIWWGKIPA